MKLSLTAVAILASSVAALPVADVADKRLLNSNCQTSGIKLCAWNPPGGGVWGKRVPSPTQDVQARTVPAKDCPWGQCWFGNRAGPTPVNMQVRTIVPDNCTGGNCWGSVIVRSGPTQLPRLLLQPSSVTSHHPSTGGSGRGAQGPDVCPGGQCWGRKWSTTNKDDHLAKIAKVKRSTTDKDDHVTQVSKQKRSTTDKDDSVTKILAARSTDNCIGGECFSRRSVPTGVAARNTNNCRRGQCWGRKNSAPTQAARAVLDHELISARNVSNCHGGQCGWKKRSGQTQDINRQVLAVQNPKSAQRWRSLSDILGGGGNKLNSMMSQARRIISLAQNTPNPPGGNQFGRAEPRSPPKAPNPSGGSYWGR